MRGAHVIVPTFLIIIWGISVPAAGQPSSSGEFVFGFYTGWTKGLGWEFDWHSRSSISDRTVLGFHLGGTARFELSRYVGVQLDLNYLSGCNKWVFAYWNWPEESGEKSFGITSLSLQGVLHIFPAKRLRVYLQTGGGLSLGEWGDAGGFSGLYYNLNAGLGLKIRLTNPDTGPAIVLGTVLFHLIDPEMGLNRTADYLRFQVGYEF